jgi:hypothetical protein
MPRKHQTPRKRLTPQDRAQVEAVRDKLIPPPTAESPDAEWERDYHRLDGLKRTIAPILFQIPSVGLIVWREMLDDETRAALRVANRSLRHGALHQRTAIARLDPAERKALRAFIQSLRKRLKWYAIPLATMETFLDEESSEAGDA